MGRPRIIIVDDDRESRELLATELRREGFDANHVANGLRLISTLHVDRPDVILLDVSMSWIDGFELCRALRQNEEFGRIPIVFVSARGSEVDVRRGLDAGADGYFVKPADVSRLVESLRRLLDARASREGEAR